MSLTIQNNKMFINDTQPTIVLFYSPNCAACNELFPLLDQIKTSNINFYLINVEQQPQIAQFINYVPCLTGFVNSKLTLKLNTEINFEVCVEMWQRLYAIKNANNDSPKSQKLSSSVDTSTTKTKLNNNSNYKSEEKSIPNLIIPSNAQDKTSTNSITESSAECVGYACYKF